ncbi:MAG: hypothetical protein ACM3YM_01190 [Sphingomonadales bacterium]
MKFVLRHAALLGVLALAASVGDAAAAGPGSAGESAVRPADPAQARSKCPFARAKAARAAKAAKAARAPAARAGPAGWRLRGFLIV